MAERPWYLVPGRKDLTEKLISSKREADARKAEQWKNNAKYFNQLDAQCKMFKQWDDKSYHLAKHGGDESFLTAPFDSDKLSSYQVRKQKENAQKIGIAKEQLRKLVKDCQQSHQLTKNLKAGEVKLITQIEKLNEIRLTLYEKQENWRLREKKLAYVRFGRDRLRQKTFLLIEELQFNKDAIHCMGALNIGEGFLTEEELAQVNDVNEGGIKIIEMYITANKRRDSEFYLLFHEEGEIRWAFQEPEWAKERQIWNGLMDRLHETYTGILFDKLEENLANRVDALKEQERALKNLSKFSCKVKKDPVLKSIMDDDITSLTSTEQLCNGLNHSI